MNIKNINKALRQILKEVVDLTIDVFNDWLN